MSRSFLACPEAPAADADAFPCSPLLPLMHWPTFSQHLVSRRDRHDETFRVFLMSLSTAVPMIMQVSAALTMNCRFTLQLPTRFCNYPDLSCPSSSNRKNLSSCIEDCIIPQEQCRNENMSRWSFCILAPFSECPRVGSPMKLQPSHCSPSQRGPHLPRFDGQRQLRQRRSSRGYAFGDHPRAT